MWMLNDAYLLHVRVIVFISNKYLLFQSCVFLLRNIEYLMLVKCLILGICDAEMVFQIFSDSKISKSLFRHSSNTNGYVYYYARRNKSKQTLTLKSLIILILFNFFFLVTFMIKCIKLILCCWCFFLTKYIICSVFFCSVLQKCYRLCLDL